MAQQINPEAELPESIEDMLIAGLNSPSSVLTPEDWKAMREEALAQLRQETEETGKGRDSQPYETY